MIECLKHCEAACCLCPVAYMALGTQEFEMLVAWETNLTPVSDVVDSRGRKEYRRNGPCKAAKYGRCGINSYKPGICEDLPPGSKTCLKFRAENPELALHLTREDIEFQDRYFGWVEED